MSDSTCKKHQPLRSVLYMPGSNQRALDKARTLAADAIIMDLEDSVSEVDKGTARRNIVNAINGGDYGERPIVVRVNGLDSEQLGADVAALEDTRPDAILVPKVSTVEDVQTASNAIKRLKASDGQAPELWAMMETPLAIVNANAIAAAATETGLGVLVIGSNDLARLTHVDVSGGREAMRSWFSACVLAARAYGLRVLDGPCNDFRNETQLRLECEEGVLLGMDGKTLIHPGQIDICNEAYSASSVRLEWAERVIAAFAAPENQDANVLSLDGEMVERLHLEIAQRILNTRP